jgi:hypothetical protein
MQREMLPWAVSDRDPISAAIQFVTQRHGGDFMRINTIAQRRRRHVGELARSRGNL